MCYFTKSVTKKLEMNIRFLTRKKTLSFDSLHSALFSPLTEYMGL